VFYPLPRQQGRNLTFQYNTLQHSHKQPLISHTISPRHSLFSPSSNLSHQINQQSKPNSQPGQRPLRRKNRPLRPTRPTRLSSCGRRRRHTAAAAAASARIRCTRRTCRDAGARAHRHYRTRHTAGHRTARHRARHRTACGRCGARRSRRSAWLCAQGHDVAAFRGRGAFGRGGHGGGGDVHGEAVARGRGVDDAGHAGLAVGGGGAVEPDWVGGCYGDLEDVGLLKGLS